MWSSRPRRSSFWALKLTVSLPETRRPPPPRPQAALGRRGTLFQFCVSTAWTGFIFAGFLGCKSGRDRSLCCLLEPSSDLMVQVSWGATRSHTGASAPCLLRVGSGINAWV